MSFQDSQSFFVTLKILDINFCQTPCLIVQSKSVGLVKVDFVPPHSQATKASNPHQNLPEGSVIPRLTIQNMVTYRVSHKKVYLI